MKIGSVTVKPLMLLLAFVPVAAFLEFTHADPIAIFVCSALAIIPLAGLMGEATEHLSVRTGPGLGGLLNGTFGNAAELIIALIALKEGLHEVVKASITGSIIGNVLLVLGLSVLAGGLKHPRQVFNATAASMNSTLMSLSSVALVIPAVFYFIVGEEGRALERELSLEIAIVLAVAYVLSLVFALKTHKHLYEGEEDHETPHGDHWSLGRSVGTLVAATVGTAVVAEFLVGAVQHTAQVFGMTEIFVGVIVVAVIGNAAEHSTAILMALKNKMDLALTIAVGSSIQVALFVAPALVFASYLMGKPMDLLFTPLEVVSVVLSAWVLSQIANDGESNWMEGVLLLSVYVILGLAFFFLP